MDKELAKMLVDETLELFKEYSENNARKQWEAQVQQDREFRLGKQISADMQSQLEARGQAAIVVNRIHPAVETAKALMTNKKPTFRATAREDSDNKVATVMADMIEYVWDISKGGGEIRQIIDDYYVSSLGYALVYQDPLGDNGKGEVKFMSLDPLDVYVDPSSRDRLFDDSANLLYSRLYTKEQAIEYKPLCANIVDELVGDNISIRPTTELWDNSQIIFPEDSMIMQNNQEYVRGIERYKAVITTKFHIFDPTDGGSEKLLNKDEFLEYLKQPIWIVAGRIFRNEQEVNQFISMIIQQTGEEPTLDELTNEMLIKQGVIKVAQIKSRNILLISIMGEQLLYVRELPSNLHSYPIIPFANLHTGTPFPTSDVRMVKDLQDYVNKIRSLIIAHASNSTNIKVLIPRGSVDMDDFEENWSRPGVGIEVDFENGAPVPVQPIPLPNELYHNEQSAINDINHQFGIYEMMMGDAAAAPQTYKATISLDEYGQRKIRSKLADIETSLQRMGEVIVPFIQQLYTQEKIIRLIQPNNSINEFVINKRMVDDKTQEIKVMNDISRGNYDIKIVTGSTLPSNRYAELELYMENYKMGIIDRTEVLKKTDIFDKEGVLSRIDAVEQLKRQVSAMGEEIKKLRGDLQTREREIYHAKQEAELSKFKTSLKSNEAEVRAAKTLYTARLEDDLTSRRQDDKKVDNP